MHAVTPIHRTRVKICGVTSTAAAAAAVAAGADAIGLVAVPASPRFVDEETIRAVRSCVPPFVQIVAVYRDPTPEQIDGVRFHFGDRVQLHGREDEALVAHAARRCGRVIRALAFDPVAIRRWNRCGDVDALLIDGPEGGSGRGFDHDALAALLPAIDKPVILAGGLDPDNVADAIRALRPFAVDVSSGVESAPGVKDPERIEAFCRAVREADAEGAG